MDLLARRSCVPLALPVKEREVRLPGTLPLPTPKVLLEMLLGVPRPELPHWVLNLPSCLLRQPWLEKSLGFNPSDLCPSIPPGSPQWWSTWAKPFTMTGPLTACPDWPMPWRKLIAATQQF